MEGINQVKKHQKPVPALGQAGGIVTKEAPIDVSNVALFNSATGKADRVGFRIEDGKSPFLQIHRRTCEVIEFNDGETA